MIIRRLLTASLVIFVFAAPLTAYANTPDLNLILDKLAALEARVASLEDKNREYKRELDRARAQLRSGAPKTVPLAAAAEPSKEPAYPLNAPQP
jgi:hypothetical protein